MSEREFIKNITDSLLDEYCIESPGELCLEDIIHGEGAVICYESLKNYCGRVYYNNKNAIITINKNIKNAGHKNFVTAHELGHFILERNALTNSAYSYMGLGYGKPRKTSEVNANIFAAELLMNEKWFVNFIKGKSLNSALLINASKYFRTSLMSAAVRYAALGDKPCKILFYKNCILRWRALNKYWDEQKGYFVESIEMKRYGAELRIFSFFSS